MRMDPGSTDLEPDELADWLETGFPTILLDDDEAGALPSIVRLLRRDKVNHVAVETALNLFLRTIAIEEAWLDADYARALDLMPAAGRLPWLATNMRDLSVFELEPLLVRAWTDPDLIVGGERFPYNLVLELFERVCGSGEDALTLSDDPKLRDEVLEKTPRIYRGDDPVHREGSPPWDGLSWTLDREIAERFANEHSGKVWTLYLGDYPGKPYAVINAHGFREVLIDPGRCPERIEELQASSDE